jgi:hypothetical protein
MAIGETAGTAQKQDLTLNLAVACVGLVYTGNARDFGLIIEAAHRDRTVLLSAADQKLCALLHLGLSRASLYLASLANAGARRGATLRSTGRGFKWGMHLN